MKHKLVVAYLSLQAALGGAWWASLYLAPATRRFYWPSDWPESGLLVFWLPDLLLFVGGSALSAWLVANESPRRAAALWLTCGAASYAGLFCTSVWLSTGEASSSVALMAPAAVATLWATWVAS